MYNFDSPAHGNGSTYSKNAEKKIIEILLKEPIFRKTEIHRLIACYPNAHNDDKNRIIVKLMQRIWNKNNSFETFRAFDHFLSIPKRSHFIHQFEVFLLGMNIILCANEKGCDLKKYFGFDNISQITHCWLLTSAAHDFGYPIESLEMIIGKLSELYSDFGLHELSRRLDEIKIMNVLEMEPQFSKMLLRGPVSDDKGKTNDIGDIVFTEVCKSLEIDKADIDRVYDLQKRLISENNHGYVSAILLYKMVVKYLDKDSSRSGSWMYDALNMAIAAVCLHSLKIDSNTNDLFFIEKISFCRNPYAFLLFFIDNIQEWNRSNFPDVDGKWAEYFLDRFSIESSKITLNYRINHERWDADDKKEVSDFLGYKKTMLEKIIPHSDKMNIAVKVNFVTNIGCEFDSIQILI